MTNAYNKAITLRQSHNPIWAKKKKKKKPVEEEEEGGLKRIKKKERERERGPLIYEGRFLDAEDSIPVFEPPKNVTKQGGI